jgi:ADP-heptose:LPS heptosyltransferase
MDCPAIDELIEIDTRAWRKRLPSAQTMNEIGSLIRALRDNRPGDREKSASIDVAIDFQGLIKSGLVALASGARRRTGFETIELRERASRIFLNEQVRTSSFTHVIEKNLALARASTDSYGGNVPAIASGSLPYEFPISVSPEDEHYIDAVTSGTGGRFAILNPGGGWPTKLWPAPSYGEIADFLSREYNLTSFITFGPGEEALAEEAALSARSNKARVLASTLKQFVALARRAALFVGGDTGPLHIAAACRTPIVGLYGPTSPRRNGPFNPCDITVGRDLWCRDECHRRSCWHWECMAIPASAVKRAISKRLSQLETLSQAGDFITSAEKKS